MTILVKEIGSTFLCAVSSLLNVNNDPKTPTPTEIPERSQWRVDVSNLRCLQGRGIESTSASLSRIARPILAQTLISVREAKSEKQAASRDRG